MLYFVICPFKCTAAGALLNNNFISYAVPSGRLESLSVLLLSGGSCDQFLSLYDKSVVTILLRNIFPPKSDALLLANAKGKVCIDVLLIKGDSDCVFEMFFVSLLNKNKCVQFLLLQKIK